MKELLAKLVAWLLERQCLLARWIATMSRNNLSDGSHQPHLQCMHLELICVYHLLKLFIQSQEN